MGCSTSTDDHQEAELAPDERAALERRRESRQSRPPSVLARDPESLSDYKRLLAEHGATSSSDDEGSADEDYASSPNHHVRADSVLRKARSITLISRTNSFMSYPGYCEDTSSASSQAVKKSVLRNPELGSPTVRTESFCKKQVSFNRKSEPDHPSSWDEDVPTDSDVKSE